MNIRVRLLLRQYVLLACCAVVSSAVAVRAQTQIRAREPDTTVHTTVTSPSENLAQQPGAVLLHDGGVLGGVRLQYRGLTQARVPVRLGGLLLNDAVDGSLALNDVPALAFAQFGSDGSGGMWVAPRDDRLHVRVLAGDASTVRVDGAASMTMPFAQARVLFDVGSTRGDFVFARSALLAEHEAIARRENNDHQHVNVTAELSSVGLPWQLTSTSWWSAVNEGIAGFATHPTAGLRQQRLRMSHAVSAERRFALGRLISAACADVKQTHNTDDNGNDSTLVGIRLCAAQRVLLGFSAGTGSLGVELEHVRALGSDAPQHAERTTMTLSTQQRLLLSSRASLDVDIAGAINDTTSPLTNVRTFATIDLSQRGDRGFRAALGLTHTSRPPTLDELYAPRGFVRANPDLTPEATSDVEARVDLSTARASLHGELFAGRIHDAILYLNDNAFDVRAQNTGGGYRAGLALTAALQPLSWLSATHTTSITRTWLVATGGGFPLVPPLASHGTVRVGHADGVMVQGVLHTRAATSANLFGTATIPGYATVDLACLWRLNPALLVGLYVDNIFHNLHVRDQNGLPLPGRQLFFTIEVST